MIVIFSELNDGSTYEVIKWLKFYKKKFIRIDTEVDDKYTDLDLSIENAENKIKIYLNNKDVIDSIWYRRSKISIRPIYLPNKYQEDLIYSINNFIREEYYQLGYYSNYSLFSNTKKVLGNPLLYDLNKLYLYELATKVGLSVPPYIVTNNKKNLIKFYNKYKTIIIKAIQNQVQAESEKLGVVKVNFTELVDKKKIDSFPDKFGYSFFQKRIPKFCDIRIFYMNEKFYSMAIHSQKSIKTRVDFRKYVDSKPNRNSVFKLPADVEEKVIKLFKLLNMNNGSVDFILSEDMSFHFLEINPTGQFGMVSFPCNYYIESDIAEFL